MNKFDIRSLSLEKLREYIKEFGQPSYRADQIFSWIHQKGVSDFDLMTNLSKELRNKFSESAVMETLKIEDIQCSKDGTHKYLLKAKDGAFIETVFMSYHHGHSLCISTQVGCAMNCAFCASGKGGFERNLSVSEILDQVYLISKKEDARIGNIVFMGMGEPLLNYDNLISAIRILNDDKGYNLSQRHMTISTCGIVPNIIKLAKEDLAVGLAISLHGATQKIREKIMPIAKQYHIDELINACDIYRKKTNRRITLEYCLIQGINDGDEDALELSKICSGSDFHINIIPYHEVQGLEFKSPSNPVAFKNKLEKRHINVTIRRDLGTDIDGACGQLRLKKG